MLIIRIIYLIFIFSGFLFTSYLLQQENEIKSIHANSIDKFK